MTRFGASLVLLALALAANAQPMQKCVDERGRTTYTNVKSEMSGKKCELRSDFDVAPVRSASGVKTNVSSKSPATFPRESGADRAASKSNQRTTLERELNMEESLLADARKKLAEQEAIRTGDEKNYARVLERLKPFQDTVEVHQKNVEALKRELNNLGR